VPLFIGDCELQGLKFTPDFNGPQPEGCGHLCDDNTYGFRESTASAYLKPAMWTANLELRLRAAGVA